MGRCWSGSLVSMALMCGSYAIGFAGLAIGLFGGSNAFGDFDSEENDESEGKEGGEECEGGGIADPCFDLTKREHPDGSGELVGHAPEAEELSDPALGGEEPDHCSARRADAPEADPDAITDDPENPLVASAGEAGDLGGEEGSGGEHPDDEKDGDGGFDADAVLVFRDDDGGDPCSDGDLEGEDEEAHFFDAEIAREDGGEGDHGLDA